MDLQHLELLARIASWYYEEEMSQEAISRRIGRSRSMVSRLLNEAREQGLVEIRVRYPLRRDTRLEARFKQTFEVKEARILGEPPADHRILLSRLGDLGAACLAEYLHDEIEIGIGWGTAIYEVVRAMPSMSLRDARVIQIIGAVGYGDPMVDGPELARWLAQKLSAQYHILHAPLIVESSTVADALLQERTIAEVLDHVSQIEVALVGIGTVNPSLSSLRRAGYVDEASLVELMRAGAVGDIVARQLDANGCPLDVSMNRRVVGGDLDSLRKIPNVIAIAGGAVKAPAILAALRGRYIDVLVTDAPTARIVLTLQGDNRHAASSLDGRTRTG